MGVAGCGQDPAPAPTAQKTPPAPSPPTESVQSADETLKVSTNDVLKITTKAGPALVQFLSSSTTLRSKTEKPGNFATYRIRFPADSPLSSAFTNTLQQTFVAQQGPELDAVIHDIKKAAQELGAKDTDNVKPLKSNAGQNSDLKIGDTKLQWSYATDSSVWLKYDTNAAAIEILSSGAFEK